MGSQALHTISLDELCSILRQSRATVLNNRVRAPHLVPPAIKIGKSLLFRIEDVDAFLMAHRESLPVANEKAPTAPRRGRPRKA